ncbi:MAG TPA: SpoIIE family protein phosphatase [Roseiarcus sp.]|jgi:serine phosphatase RsbU (regulator of sigma subunit)
MKDSPELRAAIRAASAFRELSDNNLAILIEAAELGTFDPDAVLMVQGETSDFAMLILEGEVTVSADSARGAIPISTLHAPSLVGELGALAQLPRSATARACTSVTALRFGREALVEVASATPSLLIDVIGRMGERMRKFNGAISLYTEALDALERHNLDPALLEELRNPIPDLADFGLTFGRMAEQIILRRQRDDEMASAAVIQRALLPRVRQFADESDLDVWAAMTPARDVGGDFFDLVPLADGRVALGVGDVCGKGVPAALFMGITKTLIRINLRENPDLPGAIVKANAFLADNNAGQLFATVLYAAYDPRSGALEYCNCGHLPGLIRRPGGAVETLPVGGLPVGLFEPMKVTVHMAQLRPGDLFFLYTDGVTEAEDPNALQFGDERLADLLAKKGHGARANHWIARVEAAVREFARGRSQLDDITCLALRR